MKYPVAFTLLDIYFLSYTLRHEEVFLRKDGCMQLPVTHRINKVALELLEQHPGGLQWSELLSKIKESDAAFHPKTVNGCIWKLIEKFPDKVYKPSKGLFRLVKYK